MSAAQDPAALAARHGQDPLFPEGAESPNGRDAAGWGVHRVVGMETEFGVHAPDNPEAHHSVLSTEVVNAYAASLTAQGGQVAGTEWDYGAESPLVDARGWRMPRSAAHPSQLTDEALTGPDGEPIHLLMSTVLPNGARWYVDHAHPEYSSPETTTPRAAMVWDHAGDRIALAASRAIAAEPGHPQVLLYKNNTDSKAVSYGAHENYLVARSLDFEELAAGLLPFFTARQVLVGAGRVGIGSSRMRPGFQLSQRADFFEEEVGLETTIRRPIVNTRDEPHADGHAYRRLHVIIGDATLSQHATWLRAGMTSLMLGVLEAGEGPRLVLDDPVTALQTLSHDPTLTATVRVRDDDAAPGWAQWTGLDLLERHLESCEAHAAAHGMDADPETAEVLGAWRTDLEDARRDPLSLADRADWAAKLRLFDGYRQRHGLDWDDPRLAMMDLQYADLRPEKSLHAALVRSGAMRVLASEEEIAAAVDLPPRDTRAWLRGRTVAAHGRHLAGVSWDGMLLRSEDDDALQRLRLAEPLTGREADLPGLLDPGAEAPVAVLLERLHELL